VPGLTSDEWAVWCAAVQCLRRLKQEEAVALTHLAGSSGAESNQPGSAAAAAATAAAAAGETASILRGQLRCLLILSGLLSWRELTPCRAVLISSRHDLLSADTDAAALASLLPLVAAASRWAPQTAQAQLLQEALQAAHLCKQPGNALALAAAMIGTWHQQQQQQVRQSEGSAAAASAVDAALFAAGTGGNGTTVTATAGLSALAHTLPRLFAAAAWGPSADSVATSLLAAAQLGSVPDAVRSAVYAGVLAVRQRLAASSWEVVAADVCCHV